MKYNKIVNILFLIIVLFVGCYNSTGLSSCIGKYSFEESSPDIGNVNIIQVYEINIYEYNKEIIADINIDGFQTQKRIRSKVVEDNNKLNFTFFSYLSDNDYETYKDGDILLTFEKKDSNIYTIWGEMKPMIHDNNNYGIYFKKIEQILYSIY